MIVSAEIQGKSFRCPESMLYDVQAICGGEYWIDPAVVPSLPAHPTVLDIGANVGAFSLYAMCMYDPSRILAFEPNPRAYGFLADNVQNRGVPVMDINAAVRAEGGMERLHQGRHNLGEASFHRGPNQSDVSVEVPCVAAHLLPSANIVKVDTEGCEVEILQNLDLSETHIVLLEWHSAKDRISLEWLLDTFGYELYSMLQWCPDLGVMRWRRRS